MAAILNYANYLLKYARYKNVSDRFGFYRSNTYGISLGNFDIPLGELFIQISLSKRRNNFKMYDLLIDEESMSDMHLNR